MKLAEVLSTF